MNPVFLGIAGALLAVLVLMSLKGAKTRKLKITTAEANADGSFKEMVLTRKFGDGWNDLKDMKVYHADNGKRIWLANHWVLRIEEI